MSMITLENKCIFFTGFATHMTCSHLHCCAVAQTNKVILLYREKMYYRLYDDDELLFIIEYIYYRTNYKICCDKFSAGICFLSLSEIQRLYDLNQKSQKCKVHRMPKPSNTPQTHKGSTYKFTVGLNSLIVSIQLSIF